MHWILWLIIFQEIMILLVGRIREHSMNYYLKERGYKVKKKPKSVQISDFIMNRIKFAIPIYGLLVLTIMILMSDERIHKELLKNDMLVPIKDE